MLTAMCSLDQPIDIADKHILIGVVFWMGWTLLQYTKDQSDGLHTHANGRSYLKSCVQAEDELDWVVIQCANRRGECHGWYAKKT
jgi:hypothetical protein